MCRLGTGGSVWTEAGDVGPGKRNREEEEQEERVPLVLELEVAGVEIP